MNIIGDVAGQYEALMKLVEKMPKDEFVFVGDLVDRGPDSSKVVEWVRQNGRAVLGNHEHMMIDYHDAMKIYGHESQWFRNGGEATLASYKDNPELLKQHVEFLRSLPHVIEEDDFIVTHAPINPNRPHAEAISAFDSIKDQPTGTREDIIDAERTRLRKEENAELEQYRERRRQIKADNPDKTLKDLIKLPEWKELRKKEEALHKKYQGLLDTFDPLDIIWNRIDPAKVADKIQIYGHQGKIKIDSDNLAFGIDNTHRGYVNGYNTITNQMYHERFAYAPGFEDADLEMYNEKLRLALETFKERKKKAKVNYRKVIAARSHEKRNKNV